MSKQTDENEIYTTSVKIEDDYYTTSTNNFNTAYKGKIEVTSKGRRKIFDGVRWQILCRRPDCRKQTNKKSLCITHYKEEYESFNSHASWSTLAYSFREHQSKFDEHIFDGSIKSMSNGQRVMFRNNKWFLLCQYNQTCRNLVEEDLLCLNHYELLEDRRRNISKMNIKRFKTNERNSSSSSITEQFVIDDYSTEKSSISSPSKEQSFDQSVQTDITIPLCCCLHQTEHSIYSSCRKSQDE